MSASRPRKYFCKRHGRESELMTFIAGTYTGKVRDTSVCRLCLEALRVKFRAAIALPGPHGLFDGLPKREVQP